MATKADPVQSEREQVAARRADLNKQWKSHPRATLHAKVPATGKFGGELPITIEAVDATVSLIFGDDDYTVILNREQVVRLQKRLQEAFQVVA